MARLKVNRFKYNSFMGRDRRPSSFPECLDNNREYRRRSYKNWIAAALILICLHYIYNYWFSDGYEVVPITKTIPISDLGDELLTTTMTLLQTKSATPKPQQTEIVNDITNIYKLDFMQKIFSTTDEAKFKRCIDNQYKMGNYPVNMTRMELFELEQQFPMVERGGYYRPPNCTSTQKVAIVVAFRSRDTSLAIFLYNIHPFLMMQQLEYQIFVIEQSGLGMFNKGRLYNVGFKEVSALKKFECIVFHDVDLLPINLAIQYSCPKLPRHMSSVINDTEIRKSGQDYKFVSLFGGVVSLTMEMIERVNGYSNLYFGWGGEDNDMLWRLWAVGYPIVKYNSTIGEYVVLPHNRAPENKFRHHLLATAVERYKTDGLSDLEYEIISTSSYHLYTHIVVDINPRKQNFTIWNVGDGSNK